MLQSTSFLPWYRQSEHCYKRMIHSCPEPKVLHELYANDSLTVRPLFENKNSLVSRVTGEGDGL